MKWAGILFALVLSFTAGAYSVARQTFPYTLWAEIRADPAETYRKERARFFERYSAPADTVIVGDSILSDIDWHEVLPGASIANRSIKGDTTAGILSRIPGILAPEPERVFLLVGINDLDNGESVDATAERYQQIVDALAPHTEVFAVSVLPCSDRKAGCAELPIAELNRRIAAIPNATYIDAGFGETMSDELTYDGVHLNAEGVGVLLSALQAQQAALRGPRSSPPVAAPPE